MKSKRGLTRYQILMRAAVILGLLFFVFLSFGLEYLFTTAH